MNFEFKESLFRFIFPACLFWAPILIVGYGQQFFQLQKYLVSNSLGSLSVYLIILLGSGIVISAVGGLFVKIIDLCFKPRWYKPDTEIDYWRTIDKEKEFTITKIDRRWNFYVTNLNSVLATSSSLVIVCILYQVSTLPIIILAFISIIFATLAIFGYYSVFNFDIKLKR